MRSILSIALLLLLAATSAFAHALHQSTAEAEYNSQTKTLEISLTVFINDLELALIRHTERLISLEKTPAAELDAAIQSYLAKTFIITDAAGRPAKLKWIGRELDAATAKSTDPAVTLFFEVSLTVGLKGATLEYAVLGDLFKDQMNLLQFNNGSQKTEIKFAKGGPRNLPSLD